MNAADIFWREAWLSIFFKSPVHKSWTCPTRILSNRFWIQILIYTSYVRQLQKLERKKSRLYIWIFHGGSFLVYWWLKKNPRTSATLSLCHHFAKAFHKHCLLFYFNFIMFCGSYMFKIYLYIISTSAQSDKENRNEVCVCGLCNRSEKLWISINN